jgi:hypothetical protein
VMIIIVFILPFPSFPFLLRISPLSD